MANTDNSPRLGRQSVTREQRFESFAEVDDAFEDADARIERVKRCELPSRIEALVDAYDQTVGIRDRFLWQWLYFIFPAVTLSCVDPAYEERVRDAKLIATLFVVLLDDLGEREMDRVTFEETAKVPFDHQTPNYDREGINEDTLAFGERVWEQFESGIAESPCKNEYESIFYFDVKQNVTAIDYSYTVNQHLEMANVTETNTYDCNNMMLFTYVNTDLMHSPSFDRSELAQLRQIVSKAQKMARIGNWVTTWEREVREGDYSSGIVVYALENGVVSREELYKLSAGRFAGDSDDIIERIKARGVEEHFLDEWHQNYQWIRELDSQIESVDVDSFLSGMEKLLSYHLAARGLK